MQIEIINADIFSVAVDAIVNPANKQASLWFGSHINELLRKKGGKHIIKERKEKGDINLGEAISTRAGNLPYKYVIHAAILDMYDFNPLFLLKIKQRTSDEVLRNATISSLRVADNLKIESVAYSSMGAGIGAMKIEKCADIMLQEMINFQTSYNNDMLKKIFFCVRGKEDYSIAIKILGRLYAA